MVQRRSGHVTLQDIARASGFSVSTVSIVLSEAPLSRHVAASTRKAVREMAEELGYHPDAYARSLRRRRSQAIGILAYDFTDPFCIPVLRGIQSALQTASYMPLLMDAQARRGLFDSYLKTLLERRAEGIVVIASWIFEEANLLEDVAKNRVPISIVGRDLSGLGIDSILVDNERGGEMAMRCLLDLGHRQIAVVRGPKGLFDSEPRWRGVHRAAREAGVPIEAPLIFQLPDSSDPTSSFEAGRSFAREAIAARRRFTAVLAFDDITALGVVRGLSEAGIRVPEDCSVVGFDDVEPGELSTPALTTIRQPLHSMGVRAAKGTLAALLDREKGLSRGVELFQADPELVVRGSTGPAKAIPGQGKGKGARS